MSDLWFWLAANISVWDGWAEMLLAVIAIGCLWFWAEAVE